jgi:hypothetical protein
MNFGRDNITGIDFLDLKVGCIIRGNGYTYRMVRALLVQDYF